MSLLKFYLAELLISLCSAFSLGGGQVCHFDSPGEWKGRRVRILIDDPQTVATVFLNGRSGGVLKWPGGIPRFFRSLESQRSFVSAGKIGDPRFWKTAESIIRHQVRRRENHPGIFFHYGPMGGGMARNGGAYNPMFQNGIATFDSGYSGFCPAAAEADLLLLVPSEWMRGESLKKTFPDVNVETSAELKTVVGSIDDTLLPGTAIFPAGAG